MNVLGLSAFYHDSAACLVMDGRVRAAAQEERFTRVRFDASFPIQAMRSCLDIAGITPKDVDVVAFYEKPLLRFDRAMATFLHAFPKGRRAFVDTAPAWMKDRLRLPTLLAEELGWRGRIVYVAHHEAHAASAFLASPFEAAAILTVDGVGEWTTNAIGAGKGKDITLLQDVVFPHSLGMFYAAVTEYLGFEVLADEYKVMGLAAYGEPSFRQAILDTLIDLKDDGSYRLNLDCFRFVEGERTADEGRFARLFGVPTRPAGGELEDVHADIASSFQSVLEEVLLRQVRHAHSTVGGENLVMAGGVALNAVANGRIAREGPFERVWVQPAAGDAGGAVGAALLATHRILGVDREVLAHDAMSGALLGPEFDRARCLAAARAEGLAARELEAGALDLEVAARLGKGQIVGWFQGRMEFGPRALGSRSILADPRMADAQARVNERIKFREGFRPFAPSILESRTASYFELTPPSPYMLQTAPLKAERRVAHEPARGLLQRGLVLSTIPGVTHVDGTARVQTLDLEHHPRFHALVTELDRQCGCPLVLNTSFNLRGEPIVCTPEDALRTFLASGMDALALGPLLLERPLCPPRPLPPPPPRPPSTARVRTFAKDLVLGATLATLGLGVVAWRHGLCIAAAGILILGVAELGLGLRAIRRRVPRFLARAAARWIPMGDWLGKRVSMVAYTLVYFFVVGPMARLRRGAGGPLSLELEAAASYWRAPEAPRGTPDRMY